MGGAVRDRRMAGPQVALSPTTLDQERDLPVLTDRRGLIGGLVARQYGPGADRPQSLFANAKRATLELI